MYSVTNLLQKPSIILDLQQLFPVDLQDRYEVEGQ